MLIPRGLDVVSFFSSWLLDEPFLYGCWARCYHHDMAIGNSLWSPTLPFSLRLHRGVFQQRLMSRARLGDEDGQNGSKLSFRLHQCLLRRKAIKVHGRMLLSFSSMSEFLKIKSLFDFLGALGQVWLISLLHEPVAPPGREESLLSVALWHSGGANLLHGWSLSLSPSTLATVSSASLRLLMALLPALLVKVLYRSPLVSSVRIWLPQLP
jgi:hypothetical protein